MEDETGEREAARSGADKEEEATGDAGRAAAAHARERKARGGRENGPAAQLQGTADFFFSNTGVTCNDRKFN